MILIKGLIPYLSALALGLTSLSSLAQAPAQVSPDHVLTVHKSPQCGCCGQWLEHMEENGFKARAIDHQDMAAIKAQLGIPSGLQSCHSAKLNNYVFEGHIPAELVKRFLANPPEDAYGLAVPGMPIGSPGMEMGSRHQDYDVIVLKRSGEHEVYSRVSRPAH